MNKKPETSESLIANVRDVSFAFPAKPETLSDISLTVSPGEKLNLVGPNGAGKSTLLRLLVGLLEPSAGTIELFGNPVRQPHLQEIRRRTGFVFQNPDDQLFCPTVAEDIAFGPMHFGHDVTELRRIITDTLDIVDLAGFESRRPHELSIGEKQRAAIATILSYNPDLLLLDEPSASLDPRNRRRLIEFLRNSSHTIILATHDLDLAWDVCERTTLLNNGKLIADGNTHEILADASLLESNGLELPLKLQ